MTPSQLAPEYRHSDRIFGPSMSIKYSYWNKWLHCQLYARCGGVEKLCRFYRTQSGLRLAQRFEVRAKLLLCAIKPSVCKPTSANLISTKIHCVDMNITERLFERSDPHIYALQNQRRPICSLNWIRSEGGGFKLRLAQHPRSLKDWGESLCPCNDICKR